MSRHLIEDQGVLLTIAEMAAGADVSYRTLRFYEHRGLLEPERVGSVRFYRQKDCIRLKMILKAKRLGFSLSEIERLIAHASSGSSEPTPNVISRLTKDELETQIHRLDGRREGVQIAIDGLTEALAVKDRP